MKKLMKVSLVLLVAVMFLFAGMSDLFARGGRSSGGGSRSFSRPSSSVLPQVELPVQVLQAQNQSQHRLSQVRQAEQLLLLREQRLNKSLMKQQRKMELLL